MQPISICRSNTVIGAAVHGKAFLKCLHKCWNSYICIHFYWTCIKKNMLHKCPLHLRERKQTTLSLEWNSSACCIPSFYLFLFISKFSLENIHKEELVLLMTSSVSLMKASYVYPQLGVIRQMICVVKRFYVSLRLCAAGWFPFVEMKSHRLLSEVLSFRVFCARCVKVNCWISQTAKPPSQAS